MEKLNKYERQNQILITLKNNPGITQSELSKQLNVHRATISRDYIDLSIKGALQEGDDGSIQFNDNYFLEDIQFSLSEGFSLYTSAALMVDRSDFVHPDLVSSLRKLSLTLEKSQPHLYSLFKDIANSNKYEKYEDLYTENLDKIISAWANGRQIRIKYNSRQNKKIEIDVIGILDFSPYPDGHGNHLIGLNIKTDKTKPYRFKRIEHIEILKESFDSSNREELLKEFDNSWKIWISDSEPKNVVLHFKREVSKRVLETRWHKKQITEPQVDGSLLWKCYISEPKEMEYWILGWGSNVKVLEPEQLKKSIKTEIKKLLVNYGLVAENATSLQ